MENLCICCGEVIPEGLQVCPKCMKEGGCKNAVVGNPAGDPAHRVDHLDKLRRKHEQRTNGHE